ncbi:cupin-like domain-containing protein [Pseudoduganella namucuonensis]|nr:cupin-like domain-containing protein [Pseudoduganella namucuonensis]
MSREKNPVDRDREARQAHGSPSPSSPRPPRSPPPLSASRPASPEEAAAKKLAREQRDAQVRGVTSIQAMREAIKRAGCALPAISEVPRVGKLDAAAFRERAAAGLPFLIPGLVKRWPLSALTPQTLRERYSHLPVRARVGDYINTAFAPDRAMRDMTMLEYLELVSAGTHDLPPYLGNLELRELNSLCHWPAYLGKMGPPRFWLGPAGTVTPLHCDYDDNIFAQVWGTKRIFLSPPHHEEFLYTSEANAILFGSPFDPEAPDFDKFPLARQATMIECVVHPGDLLYVPAGWWHQVRALTFSLSANRWARAMPFALHGDPALRRPA